MLAALAQACLLLTPLDATRAQAQVSWAVSEAGALSATAGGQPLVQDLAVLVPGPGWTGGVYSQLNAEAVHWERGRAGSVPQRFEGELRGDQGNAHLSVEYRLEGDGVRARFELTPEAAIATEGVFLTCHVPTATYAGQGHWWRSDGVQVQSAFFPAVLPDPFHISDGPAGEWLAWTLADGKGISFGLNGSGLGLANLQDDREFDIEDFSLQLRSAASPKLEPGSKVVMEVLLVPTQADQLSAEQQRLAAARAAMRLDYTSREPLALRAVTRFEGGRPIKTGASVGLYGLAEWHLDLTATFDNPFDPRDVDVVGEFVAPSGRALAVPAFYARDYTRELRNDQEVLTPAGDPGWRLRLTPAEVGEWRLIVRARDRSGTVASQELRFDCRQSPERGFVRRSDRAEHYLRFDSGEPYFAVGEDVCWPGQRHTYDYDDWFTALGAAGGNFARIWLVRWNMALEWTQGDGHGEYCGAGRYSLDNAWRLDHLLDLAQREGIYVMLSLGYHGELMAERGYFGEQCFDKSPYNQVNGGPCATPEEFWTNEEARRLYKQRLRYLVARYGFSTHLQSWEFWNEVWAPADWMREMSDYLHEIDPYQHLRTTTYGGDDVWNLPSMDFAQDHHYGSPDIPLDTVPRLSQACRSAVGRLTKPFLVGEFGIDFTTSDTTYDPQYRGTNLHNGLWATTMSGSFGGGSLWYWDGYVHPGNLYHEFTPLARFAARVDWPNRRFRPAETTPPTYAPPAGAAWGDIEYRPSVGFARATGEEFTVTPQGEVTGPGSAAQFLFSPSKPDLRAPLRFRVDAGPAAQFRMHVDSVFARALLIVTMDGQEVLRKEYRTGGGEGPWKETRYYEQWSAWQSRYDEELALDLPPGEHTLELTNEGDDWVSIPSYTFAGCRDPRYPALECLGLRTRSEALLWVHDQKSTWEADRDNIALPDWSGVAVLLAGLRDGTYEVTWWDTRRGESVEVVTATCLDGSLPLVVPTFSRDIAAHIQRSPR